MTDKKRYGWITGGLATLVAGYLSCAYLTPCKQPAETVPSASPQSEPTTRPYDAGRSRTLNNFISSIRQNRAQRNDYTGFPADEYSIEETFPVDVDSSMDELGDLFHNDCEVVCMYMRNADNTVTKVKLNRGPQEPIRWYDEDNECSLLQGNNFWFYVNDQGVIKAWGIGKDMKTTPEKVYSACE